MNILFLTLNPKNGMYGSLIAQFSAESHHVVVVSPTKDNTSFEKDNNVETLYFNSLPLQGVGLIRKGLADLLFPYFCLKAVKKYTRDYNPDIIISTTPPLGFYFVIRYFKKKNLKCKGYLILRDIWPEAFKLLGFDKKHPFVYKFYRTQERKLYALSDEIGCMSQGNIKFVAESNPETISKLTYLPNWAIVDEDQSADESIRDKYGFSGKLVFIFGGNMSLPQGLENVVTLAEVGKEYDNVVFLVIGKGTEKQKFVDKIKERKLNNVIVMDYLPPGDYQQILGVCDVGLISLNDKLKTPSIPSKTLSYWNLGKPIFAIIDHITDYGDILDESKSGLWARAGDIDRIKESFRKIVMDSELRNEMGRNGRRYLQKECNVEVTYQRIMEQLYGNK